MADRICSVAGCTKPNLARGLCGMHYMRVRNHGTPGPAACQKRPPGSREECATEDCGKPARRNGLCDSCSAKARRAGAGDCTISGCTGRADSRGLCGKHYQQVRNGTLAHPLAAEILRETPCAVNGCEQAVYARSLCNMHWVRNWRLGDPGEAERRKVRWTSGQQCAVSYCERPPRWGVYCGSHARRFRRFGITEAELDALLARQKNRCAVCKSKAPYGSGDWHIDHDHVTGQVRGLLCSKCNTGIGMLNDDPKVITAALRYVTRHRQMQMFGPAGPVASTEEPA